MPIRPIISALCLAVIANSANAQDHQQSAHFAPVDASALADQIPSTREKPKLASLTRGEPGAASVFVDLVAADFFEHQLRLTQSRRIEAATADRYLSLSSKERELYRQERQKIWMEMTDAERASLRSVKRPRFANLDEGQKQTFRRIASEELGRTNLAPENVAHKDDI
ncbi:hypothetical protein [Hyphococcus lacteus]|uniref:DUF3106 domain-containing protein n=1 Tax=Hyphococcus lacteus TaxID=3143536 RepID=A0ABV3Z6A5_9PROT